MAIKCVIIDDDKVFTQILEHYIEKVDFIELKKVYHSSSKAFNEIDFEDIDLIYLDMEIPDMHGLDFLKAIPIKPAIVFVSKDNTYGPEAFEYEAIDYLHKPISFSRFLKSCNKLKSHFNGQITPEKNDNNFFIRHEGLWQKLKLDDIGIIKADNNYVIIITDNNKYRTNIKLKEIENKLPQHQFMQVHRSYIVQLNKITRIDGEVIEVNGKTIPVSRTYLSELYKRLNIV
ncbi:MAG: response regulator transcription factor [Flavobacteriales bacterium]|nr:response regulator transcription factor [Flavobacteriales bacterium]